MCAQLKLTCPSLAGFVTFWIVPFARFATTACRAARDCAVCWSNTSRTEEKTLALRDPRVLLFLTFGRALAALASRLCRSKFKGELARGEGVGEVIELLGSTGLGIWVNLH